MTATLDTCPTLEPERLAVQQDLFEHEPESVFRIALIMPPEKPEKPLPLWIAPLPHTALWNAYQSQRLWFLPQTSIDSAERKAKVERPMRRFKSEKSK